MPIYTPLISLAAVALCFGFAFRVARAHRRFDVPLPAMAGNPDFDRVFRAHANTLEWMPIFLVPLWLTAIYFSDIAAALLGLLWIVGRLWYFIGYSKAVEKRAPGFLTQFMACLLLFAGALIGILRHWPVH
ncbi:MAPEG family protein [Sphingomonas sp.]|uniref:MAPEG family protein n=1 Tax=Sphingomonas sp. TaxID=28214 RepID=UPI0031D4444D